MIDALLATMNHDFEAVYACLDRALVIPERLLKSFLLSILFSISSKCQLVEAVS